MTEPSDIALMERVAFQNPDALKSLYDRYGRVAFALAYRIIGEASGAEEVVQDAYETIWNKSQGFDPAKGGNVRGWLLTIIRHRAIDYQRREQIRPPTQVPLDSMERTLATPDVWKEVSAHLLTDQVRSAMRALPTDQRRVIELAYFEGLSHRAIAEREQAPLGTVKGRMRLGLHKLSTLLECPSTLETVDEGTP